MVSDENNTPAEPAGTGAESLGDLAREADMLDAAPALAAQAGQAAAVAEVIQSNEAELYGTLQAVRAMVFPLLSMAVEPARMAMLANVWNDGVLQSTASAGAAVLERHGITMGQVMGQFGPYVMLVAAVAPPVLMTKKILSAPAEKPAGEGAAHVAGQQQ